MSRTHAVPVFATGLLLVLSSALLTAQAPPAAVVAPVVEPVDEAAVTFLRQEGLERSQVMEHLSTMCDVHGPRLTGSINLRNAQAWAVQAFTGFGLQNARTEEWGPFGRAWRMDRCVVEVVGDNPWPVIAYAKAWSPAMSGICEVVAASELDAEALGAMDLAGKVVFLEGDRTVSEPFDGEARRLDSEDLLALADQAAPRGRQRAQQARDANDFRMGFQRREAVLRLLAQKRPAAIVDRAGKGDYGTVFVSGASALPGEDGQRRRASDPGAEVIPQFTMAVEHYNRILRLLRKGVPVKLGIELKVTWTDTDLMERNVLAEIPGGDPERQDQVVMIGAHFDSWHTGTGTTDNGCGSAVVMEAARLLAAWVKQSGAAPRRTIRAALWSGEEQGLLGSRAYARQHFGERGAPTAEHGRLAGYFNLDNGTGRVRGVYLQGNAACAPIFRAWLRPFHDLDARTLTLDDTGGTDHLAFDGLGIPGFQFIQDPVNYSTRTHHSNMDVWDHAVADDLRQASVLMAAFAWHTAQRDEMLPRKPLPAAGEGSGRRGR